MNLPEYEYKGLIAESWDVLRGDTSNWPDRTFYLELIKKYGQPVLDVGCGTGRLLLDYLAQGVDIDGVDNSPDMLAICRRKAADLGLKPDLYLKHIENLTFPRRYRTVLIPSSTIQLITEPSMVVRALQRIRDFLHENGIVAASIIAIAPENGSRISEWEAKAERESDGVTFRRVAWSQYNPDTETEDTRDLYQKIVDGRVVQEERHERLSATRSYDQAQARALFEEAGYRQVDLLSGFTFDPAQPDDRLFVVIAGK